MLHDLTRPPVTARGECFGTDIGVDSDATRSGADAKGAEGMKKMHKIHSFAVAAAAGALLLAGCGPGQAKKDRAITVERPWVRLPAVAGEPGAAYFRLTGGAEGTSLVGVSSPLVKRIELHESMTGGAMASMKKLDSVDFAYDGTIEF